MAFVFKIERPSIEFEAQLSNGESIPLRLFESSAKQLQELEKQGESVTLARAHLEANLEGERALEFIEDLFNNGSLAGFYAAMSEQFKGLKKERESRRKN